MSNADLISVSDAADRRGVSHQAVYKALNNGTLTEERAGSHRLIVKDEAFEAWMQTPPQPGTPKGDDSSHSS